MALYYPDVSSAQAGMSLAGAAAVCAKVTQDVDYVNPDYQTFQRQAAAENALFFAYHFLTAGRAEAQAGWCYQHAGRVPLMVDTEPEPEISSYPTLADLTGFVDAYRRLGGTCWLSYLPRWYWANPVSSGGLGAPSLAPLIQRRMRLVSSDYVNAYSDDGPGWEPYGGMVPDVWQFTSTADWNGRVVDRNAFKGTLAQLRLLVSTGSAASPAKPQEEDDMMLEAGAGAETIITFTKGSKGWVAFGCDASRTRRPAPKLRVAVHSASRGMSQLVEDLALPVSGKASVNFTARDADMISVVRVAGGQGDDVPVGYNLG